jgi:hypothetical protein
MQMTLKDYKLLALLLVGSLLAVASFANQKASGKGVLPQEKKAASKKRKPRVAAEEERVSSDRLVWLDNYQAAIEESKATGKPIFLEFRCGP